MTVREPVEKFALAMEAKLAIKDEEMCGWHSCSIKYLLDRMHTKVREATDEFEFCDPAALAKECVDIANFAMMIHDTISTRE